MAAGFNFPSRLPRINSFQGSLAYPLNLTTSRRNFYTSISFRRYEINFDESPNEALNTLRTGVEDALSGFSDFTRDNLTTYVSDDTNIFLPIPRKLNENQVLSWSELSFTDILSSLGTSNYSNPATNVLRRTIGGVAGGLLSTGPTIARLSSPFTGVTVNPFVFVYFDRPQFKRYSFTWTLAARNRDESEAIQKIVLKLKERSSPTIDGLLMGYPDIVDINFAPDEVFGMLKMKPCVIEAVSVDYTPSGPSFFESNAPTMVNLTINLKEIELWEQSDYREDRV